LRHQPTGTQAKTGLPDFGLLKLFGKKKGNKMMKRPMSVSVIAWILIVLSSISVGTSLLSFNNPMVKELMAKSPVPIPLQYVMMYVGLLISIVAGIAMLKGQNWARFLYVIWSAIGFVIGIATSPMKAMMIPGLVMFVLITIFLFRPEANEYFSPKGTKDDAQSV
jgi:hypothetical protein